MFLFVFINSGLCQDCMILWDQNKLNFSRISKTGKWSELRHYKTHGTGEANLRRTCFVTKGPVLTLRDLVQPSYVSVLPLNSLLDV